MDKSTPASDHAVAYINVERKLYDRIVELAKQNERSISGEIRLAIRHHLEAQKAAA